MAIKVGASILAADFGHLDKQIRRIEKAGIDFFHVDIMDGFFVPNITIGPGIVADIRRLTRLPLDVHLMIKQPIKWSEQFIAAGSDMLTFHIETIAPSVFRKKRPYLKSKGIKLGISLNPHTPLARIKPLLNIADFVLVMTVNPGFGGQKFIPSMLPKIRAAREHIDQNQLDIILSVDGGIKDETIPRVLEAGVTQLVMGAYIFGSGDIAGTIEKVQKLCSKA